MAWRGTWKDLDGLSQPPWPATLPARSATSPKVNHSPVAKGRLCRERSRWMVRGEILELKNTANTMVDQLQRIRWGSKPVLGGAKVSTDGQGWAGRPTSKGRGAVSGRISPTSVKLHGRQPPRFAGPQHRAGGPPRFAKGDLSTKITVDARGEILELKEPTNQHHGGSAQRVRQRSDAAWRAKWGTEGKLGRPGGCGAGVAGTWKDLTDSVNYMASNLTNQVRQPSRGVTTAPVAGAADLTTKDHSGCTRRNSGALRTPSNAHGGSAQLIRRRKVNARGARKWERKASLGGTGRGPRGRGRGPGKGSHRMRRETPWPANLTNQVRATSPEVTTAVRQGRSGRAKNHSGRCAAKYWS